MPAAPPAVAVIAEPARAAVALEPARALILSALREPDSASGLAASVGMSRQLVNHHLRALEQHGLVALVEERRKGAMTERVVRATADSWVIAPEALGPAAPDPAAAGDRLSAGYLLALGARLVSEVGRLVRGATAAGRRLATLSADAEVAFATAADRGAFAEELTAALTGLVARYHQPDAPGARPHRLVVALHPIPAPSEPPQEEQP